MGRNRRPTRALAAAIALPLLFASSATFAQETPAPSIAFAWDAAEGCPTSADVAARIALRVQRPRLGRSVRAFVVQEIAEVRVRVVDGGTERNIVAPTCQAAAEAVAVVVALASDGDERAVDTAPTPTAAATPAGDPLPPKKLGREVSEWMAVLHASAAVDTATLAKPSPGMTMGAEARHGSLSGGLRIGGFLPETARVAGRPAEADIGLFDAMATACARASVGLSFELGGCAGAGVGLSYGSSAAIAEPDFGIGWRPQGEFLGRAALALSSDVWLRLDAGIVIDPVRSPFRIANLGEVHRPAAATFRASGGLEIRIR